MQKMHVIKLNSHSWWQQLAPETPTDEDQKKQKLQQKSAPTEGPGKGPPNKSENF